MEATKLDPWKNIGKKPLHPVMNKRKKKQEKMRISQ
jgi:hypothetical protein